MGKEIETNTKGYHLVCLTIQRSIYCQILKNWLWLYACQHHRGTSILIQCKNWFLTPRCCLETCCTFCFYCQLHGQNLLKTPIIIRFQSLEVHSSVHMSQYWWIKSIKKELIVACTWKTGTPSKPFEMPTGLNWKLKLVKCSP